MNKLIISSIAEIQITGVMPDTIDFTCKGKKYTLAGFDNSTMLYERVNEKGDRIHKCICTKNVAFNVAEYIFIHPRFKNNVKCADRTRFVKALEMNNLATGPFSEEWRHIKRKINKKGDKIAELMAETIKMCDNLKEEQQNLKEKWLQGN